MLPVLGEKPKQNEEEKIVYVLILLRYCVQHKKVQAYESFLVDIDAWLSQQNFQYQRGYFLPLCLALSIHDAIETFIIATFMTKYNRFYNQVIVYRILQVDVDARVMHEQLHGLCESFL